MRGVSPGEKRCVDASTKTLRHTRSDGSTVCQWQMVESMFKQQWCLHMCADQGPKSLPMQSFLQYAGLNMTCEPDLLHRLHNSWLSALSSSTMVALRVEFRQVYQLRGGPFRSQAFHSVLGETVNILKRLRGSECVLFGHFYEEYCKERGVDTAADFGTSEHEDLMFRELLDELSQETVQGAKLSRWFTWEARTERMMKTTFSGM
eukprot:4342389-Amphidinium_carterae.1